MSNLSIFKKNKTKLERARKERYKNLKYICNKCGAYNHIDQGYCGMCMSTHLRRATEKEKQKTLSFIAQKIDSRS